MSSLAIIGTAGRKDDANKLTSNHYVGMVKCAMSIIERTRNTPYEIKEIISGGAAWADHVAVSLYLKDFVPNLKLHLPCAFISEECRFYSNNYGSTLNYYHRAFSSKVYINSLEEIGESIKKGCKIQVSNGFFARNDKVAQSDYLLAMTFGKENFVKKGGTSHTVKTYLSKSTQPHFIDRSFHFDLNTEKLYLNAKIID